MREMKTSTGRRFLFKGCLGEEFIVYPSDKTNTPQEQYAIAITPWTVNLVLDAIRERGRVLMGASRDKPPHGSLGALLKESRQSPQQLSYLVPILSDLGFCEIAFEGKAVVVHSKGS